jgi:hypothetical protein
MHSPGGLNSKEEEEMNKFANKSMKSKQDLDTVTEALNDTIKRAKAEHDVLMDDFAVCFAVCQAELYAQVASKMQEEILKLPQDKVATIQSRVREHIKKGGAFISDTKSSLQVATDVLSGNTAVILTLT